jgi:tRNA threonylcarbamoyladenosine biosynthesis protein TsaB
LDDRHYRPMATVIGFDTATDDTAVAALRDGEVLFSRSLQRGAAGRPVHATKLLYEVEQAAGQAGGWERVGRIAVGVGPGSFTGLRIGIATAKSLGAALEIEIAAVGTLAALARGAAPSAEGRPLLAALDARRGELFAALYDEAGEQQWEPFVAAPAELGDRLSQLPESPLVVGSGALRFRDELQERGAEIPGDSHPSHRIAGEQVCAIGAAVAPSDPNAVTPIYLRPPDAERWRERDSTEN